MTVAMTFDEIVARHTLGMTAVARRFFRDAHDAADAVQDAFLAAFRFLGKFRDTCSLATWLHRITVNCCLVKLRSRRRRPAESLEAVACDPAALADDDLERNEVVNAVRSGIARLPAAYRKVIELRDLEGLDTAATARRLGANQALVKTRLHRARQALRDLLNPTVAV
jgi:RNA polymerase sigma-70 factor (ECF subfamily)